MLNTWSSGTNSSLLLLVLQQSWWLHHTEIASHLFIVCATLMNGNLVWRFVVYYSNILTLINMYALFVSFFLHVCIHMCWWLFYDKRNHELACCPGDAADAENKKLKAQAKLAASAAKASADDSKGSDHEHFMFNWYLHIIIKFYA